MTIEEAYDIFLLKTNRNKGSNNVIASESRFVKIYNEEQIRRVEFLLDQKNDDDVREIQGLLKQESLTSKTSLNDRDVFELPEDYLDYSSAYALVDSKKCKGLKLYLREIKDGNASEKLQDINNKPSLDFREAPIIIGDGKLQVFVDGFSVQKVELSYYRYPRAVDLEGYTDRNGVASTSINPELKDNFINKVINMSAKSWLGIYGDQFGLQVNNERTLSNN